MDKDGQKERDRKKATERGGIKGPEQGRKKAAERDAKKAAERDGKKDPEQGGKIAAERDAKKAAERGGKKGPEQGRKIAAEQGRKKAAERGREQQQGSGWRRSYLAVPSVIALVVVIAFFTPQIMFRIQDSVLHRRTELSRRERMDVEALSSGYEKSLYQRMLNFAEGLAMGDSFYVTAKSLEDSEDSQDRETLEKFLYSDYLFQGMTELMVSLNLIPVYAYDSDFTVGQWKQYVVYSNNYTKGVNFILWYIELVFSDGIVLHLLTDAETGTLYALKASGGRWVGVKEYVLERYRELFSREMTIELWLLCASHFETVSSYKDLLELATGSGGAGSPDGDLSGQSGDSAEADHKASEDKEIVEMYDANVWLWREWIDGYGTANLTVNEEPDWDKETYAALMSFIEDRIEEDWENRSIRIRLPYKAASVEVALEFAELVTDEKGMISLYPDIVMGVRQLYEMIPEFQ